MASRIQNFLNGEVKDYLISDIQRLLTLRPEGQNGLRACAIPTAMFLFVILDFFGFLCRTDSRKPNLGDTKGNLRAVFIHPLAKLPSEYSSRLDTLVSLFRHGLMHQIFPKAAGIRKAGEQAPLLETIQGLDHLNVDRMGRDVLAMLDGFQSGLPDSSWAGLEQQMSDRLDRLSESDFFEMKHKKEAEHGVT